MKKHFPAFILFFGLFLFFSFAFASRPYSVECPFQGEITGFKETTYPGSFERFRLEVKVISKGNLSEEQARLCSLLEETVISGDWYTSYPEATADKEMVLRIGSIINASIDSYDHDISELSLVKEGKETPATAVQVPEPAESAIIQTVFLALILGLLLAFLLFLQNRMSAKNSPAKESGKKK